MLLQYFVQPRRLTRSAFLSVLALAAALLFAAPSAGAQNPPALTAQPNTIYLSGEGKFESAPDTALIQFNINAQANTSQEAYARASQAAERMRQVLRANQVDPKSAELGYYSLQPVYDWKSAKHKIIAYRVTGNVGLRLKDFSRIAPLVEQLAAIEDTEGQSLNYFLDDIDAAKIRAIEDAFQRLRAEAAAVARAGGRSLGGLVYSSVDTYENRIVPMMRAEMAQSSVASAPPAPTEGFSPQKITVTARVNAIFEMK